MWFISLTLCYELKKENKTLQQNPTLIQLTTICLYFYYIIQRFRHHCYIKWCYEYSHLRINELGKMFSIYLPHILDIFFPCLIYIFLIKHVNTYINNNIEATCKKGLKYMVSKCL